MMGIPPNIRTPGSYNPLPGDDENEVKGNVKKPFQMPSQKHGKSKKDNNNLSANEEDKNEVSNSLKKFEKEVETEAKNLDDLNEDFDLDISKKAQGQHLGKHSTTTKKELSKENSVSEDAKQLERLVKHPDKNTFAALIASRNPLRRKASQESQISAVKKRHSENKTKREKQEEENKGQNFTVRSEQNPSQLNLSNPNLTELQSSSAEATAPSQVIVSKMVQIIQKMLSELQVGKLGGQDFATMKLQANDSVPSCFQNASLSLTHTSEGVIIRFSNFDSPQDEALAIQAVEQNKQQLEQLVKNLESKRIAIADLQLGDHSVTLPESDKLTPEQLFANTERASSEEREVPERIQGIEKNDKEEQQ